MSEHLDDTTVLDQGPDASPPPRSPRTNEPAVGSSVGRYVILELVGRGAMGRVLRAYDPKLQREVALKLVSGSVLDSNTRDRVLREARAMAQLSHPNVVGLFDAEESDSGVMLVMEYVPGQTLREWVKARTRGWPELVERFRDAGRGLAAAHATSLLHRDFKADNVLVAESGAVKVTDFGLAKLAPNANTKLTEESLELSSEEAAQASGSYESSMGAALDSALTHAGTVMGTPRYMAPEQHRGEPLDARADQYAFCVALWEALVGRAPFRAKTLAEIAAEKHRGAPAWPTNGPRLPRPIVEALARGLAPEPDGRWPSMDALLEALAYDPRRRRNRWLLGLAGVGAAGLAVGAWQGLEQRRAARCSGASEHLVGVWDQSRRDEVRTAVLSTEVSFAPSVWERAEAALDRHADGWVAMHTEACEATTVRGEQSAEVMDLRMGCLRRAKVELVMVVEVLAEADAEVVENADDMVDGLAALDRCADVDALRAAVEPPPPDEAEAVESIRSHLAEAKALRDAGRFGPALETVEMADRQLARLSYEPIIAEVALAQGQTLDDLGRYAESEQQLRRALDSALRWQRLELVQRTAVRLMYVLGAQQWRTSEALQLRELALALATTPRAEAEARDKLANVLSTRGEFDAAEAEYRRALALHEQASGPDHPDVATTRTSLALVLDLEGKPEEAVREHRKALELLQRVRGPEHPDTAHARNNLALGLHGAGQYDEAEAQLRSALALHERIFGPDHPQVAATRNNLGLVLDKAGRAEEAEVEHRLALELRRKALGHEHPDVAQSWNNLALALYSQGKYEAAADEQRRALELQRRTLGPEHPDVIQSIANLGLMLDAQNEPEEGEAALREALTLQQRVLGHDHPRVAISHNNLGLALYNQGELESAEREFRRALEINEARLGPDHPIVALSHNNVGQALYDQGKHEQSLQEQRLALELYVRTLGPEHPDVAMSRSNIALNYKEQGDLDEAEAEQQRALKIWEKALVPDHPNLALIRHNLADTLIDLDRHEEALPLLEAAWERRQRDDIPAVYRAVTGFELARTLWRTNQHASVRARARTLAEQARDEWARLGPDHADDVEVVDAWLANPDAVR